MFRGEARIGTRRRLLITAPGVAALMLTTREQGRAKPSRRRKKEQARIRQAALDAMSAELSAFPDSIARLQQLGSTFQKIGGLESLGDELVGIAAVIETSCDNLSTDLAIARGEASLT